MKKSFIFVMVGFVATVFLPVSPASADQWAITVPDAGFDDHVLNYVGDWIYIGDSGYTGAWKSAGGGAWIDYGYYAAYIDLPALSGNNKLYGEEDYIYQILDETFIEGGTYTLSVWVGIAWRGYARGWSLYFTGEDYENNLIEASGLAPLGSWGQVSLVYTATAADAGKKIGIKMTEAIYVTFEDVTLSYDGPPGPPIATNPTPADGGGVYDDYVWLEWTAGETAAEHDVYLGTDEAAVAAATPASPEFQANLPLGTESYIVTGLVPGTTYYWRIDEVEAGGSPVWKGRVWSFSVLPSEAHTPSPVDGARFVDPNADLSWSGGFKASMHEVFFGTDPCSLASIYKSGPSTCDPGSLLYDTTYYWRVTELRMESPTLIEAPGPIWSFTTSSHRVGELQRIIAWNIEHLGGRGRTQEQLDAIAERILGFDAAVLALQEIREVPVFEYIRSQLGPSWKIYHPGWPYSDNALLYDGARVELLSANMLDQLDNPPYTPYPTPTHPRPVTGVFRPAGMPGAEPFRVIGVHCRGVEPQTRAAEGEWLRKKIVEFLNDPRETNDIILLGDLNGQPPGGAPHPQLQQGGYIYLLPKENGDDTGIGHGSIDHFYVTETARDKVPKESSFVIRPEHYGETPWEFKGTYSDHYPIFIDIDFVWSSAWAGRPIPADGAFGLSTDVVLRWTAGTKAESHDVYFGADEAAVVAATPSSPEYKGNQTATTYPLTGLEMETTYYWRIDEVNDADTWTGDVWSFTTRKVYYVDGDAEGANDGSSWADAYNDLQDALTAAWRGDEIRVAQGVYKPDEDSAHPNGTGSRTATFRLKNGVAIYGGFPPGGGTWEERDPNNPNNETILSGDLMANDGPNFTNNGDNSYHVVTGSWTNATALLDGFTITAGNANGYGDRNMGGGMYNEDGSPTLTNCTFTSHWATESGAAVENISSSPTFTNCTFSGNWTPWAGGGMDNCSYSSPTLTNCTFSGNLARWDGGGGMNNHESSPTVTNCTFSGNSAGEAGGGMHNYQSSPMVTNCTFSSNSARHGGGILNHESSPTLTDCTFIGNSAGESGGGLNNSVNSNSTVTNCTFSGNSAEHGGGMNIHESSPTLTNCTFSDNSAEHGGGGLNNSFNSNSTLMNCTFSENSAEGGGGMHCYYSNPAIINCTFTSNWAKHGGGMANNNSSPTLTNCTFSGNSSEYGGGGMNNWDYCMPALTNCMFTGNSADGGGGMVNGWYSNLTVDNCTFSGNSARWEGGGVSNNNSSSTLTNCILWGNTAGSQIHNDWGCSATVSYSDVQGGWPGTGNINANPMFVGPKFGEPPEAPIAHWKFDEDSGTTAYDSVGGNNGTVYGAQWTTGQIGGALEFDGINDYVDCGNNESLQITGTEISLSAWVKWDSADNWSTIAVKASDGSWRDGYGLYAHSDNTVNFYVTQWNVNVASKSFTADGLWHHVVGTYDGSNVRIYVDAVEGTPDSYSGSISNANHSLEIGRGYSNLYNFDGLIDDVRIYDRALSAEEIQQYYQMDYHLLPTSPCIDAGDNTAVPADTIDLDGDGDTTEPIPWDLDGGCRFVDNPDAPDTGNGTPPIVDMGAYEFAPVIEVPMHFTPQALNPRSRGKWLKAHFVLPEGFVVEDVDANVPATLEPVGIESDYINVFADKGRFGEVGVEIGFDRAAFCSAGIDYGPAEVTVMGRLSDCRYFYGTDTIRIINNNLKYLAVLASHWLEADCGAPDWCSGVDLDQNTVVDFVDFVLFDGCCIEVIKE